MTYAITLEYEEKGSWRTVRLWDNADFGSVNDAMAVAIAKAKAEAAEMVRQWRRG